MLPLMVLGLPWAYDAEAQVIPAPGAAAAMEEVTIEQRGGFTGMGAPGGRLRTSGRVAWSALSEADRAALDRLFAAKRPAGGNLYYHLTRIGPAGSESVDVSQDQLPPALAASLATTLE